MVTPGTEAGGLLIVERPDPKSTSGGSFSLEKQSGRLDLTPRGRLPAAVPCFGVIDRSIGEPPYARRCRRTDARRVSPAGPPPIPERTTTRRHFHHTGCCISDISILALLTLLTVQLRSREYLTGSSRETGKSPRVLRRRPRNRSLMTAGLWNLHGCSERSISPCFNSRPSLSRNRSGARVP